MSVTRCRLLLHLVALAAFAAPATAAPRWTVSADVLALGRSGSGDATLVALVPGNVPWLTLTGPDTSNTPGVPALNSRAVGQTLTPGVRLTASYTAASGGGVDLGYFNVPGLHGQRATGPYRPVAQDPGQWLVMKAPGSFWQTQDYAYQAMVWATGTRLQGAEAGLHHRLTPRLTLLAGGRWLRLGDQLQGTLTPNDLGQPLWKTTVFPATLVDAVPAADAMVVINPPFWTTTTANDLYGAQIGARATLWQRGRLSLAAALKAGVYANHASQTSVVSMAKQLHAASSSAHATAVSGEAEITVHVALANGVALRLGYDALWLGGVALAPAQIAALQTTKTAITAPGIDTGNTTLFNGLSCGLEVSF